MSQTRDAFVVCPTEYGGHIEHAYDVARGLLEQPDVQSVTIISRPGARDYLGAGNLHDVRVAEVLPPRRLPGDGRGAAVARAAGQVVDLAREQRAIRRVVSQATGTPLVVMEVLRYPVPQILAPGEGAEVVSFLHNAKPHFDMRTAGPRQRFLMALQSACLDRSDRVVVHGVTQRETATTLSRTPVHQAPLPVTSYLSAREEAQSLGLGGRAICIGEVRANKGVELAIAAAQGARVPLTVLGKTESPELAHVLETLSREGDIDLQDRFLSRDEFEAAIAQASLVVLPYTHFDAQSGILSKAVGAGRRILCADLPALRDQAGDYSRISYADPADAAAFGQAMREALMSEETDPRAVDHAAGRTAKDEWGAVADAILGRR